jgi:hypothetical protein
MNTGNWTTAFTPNILNINVAYFELYKMMVANVPVGFSASCVLNLKQFSYTTPYQGSEWDPAQPIPMNPTDELDLLWNIPVSNTTIPVTTAWFRYDPALQGAS